MLTNLRTLPEAERHTLAERAAILAVSYFGGGFNCAESVLRGVCETLGLATGEALLMAATPFGGGLGRAGAVCGALSGGIMALGLAFGRTTPDPEQRSIAYAHAQHLWQRFVERAGSESCRTINTLGFDHPDHKAFCTRIVAIGAELAAEELLAQ